ncbi:hypothetical protein Fcan01_16365 [Folsomia candida]|uniref:Uncharacterized protein n=1 Tax=Folsomia candida TaxID=158441 RepID=A0A226DV95_FOLCA|nr:hypothetical protein Fcan01_16365 [Folsomia candida]
MLAPLVPFLLFLTFPIVQTTSLSIPKNGIGIISKLLQNQVSVHTYGLKTVWLYIGNDRNLNTPSKASYSMKEFLPALIQESDCFLFPVIMGNFGKEIRSKHRNFHSFIFLAVLNAPQEMEEFIQTNGNNRRDRFIFIGTEPKLPQFFRRNVIKGLKDKVGLTIPPRLTLPHHLLLDPLIHSPTGEMVNIPVPLKDVDFSQIIKIGPLMCRNFRGRHLKITGSLLPTWLYRVSDPESPQGLQHDGSNYRIFVEAAAKFNFTFDLDAPPGKEYAMRYPNGTWGGQTGDLFYTERGYTNSIYLGQIYGLNVIVDYASTIDPAHLMFFSGHAKMESNSESFLLPYQRDVWIGVIGVYFAITLSKVPLSVRGIVGLWLILTIVTGTGYRCNLASFLSVPKILSVPRTFAELHADPEYQIILNNVGVPEVLFFQENENPEDDLHPLGWNKIVRSAAYGALTINTRLEPFMASTDVAMLVPMSVAFVKDSILVDAFMPWTAEALFHFKLKGKANVANMNKTDHLYKALKGFENSIASLSSLKPFDLGNVKIPFVALIFGLFVSFLAFLAELSYSRWSKRIKKAKGIANVPAKKEEAVRIFVESQL